MEKYIKVIIKSEADLPKVLHETKFWAHTKSGRMIETNIAWTWRVNEIDWYLLPEPESTELTDLKQYVTNLLYASRLRGDDFDKWVEEQTNNLDQYFQSQPEAREMPDDFDIKEAEIEHTKDYETIYKLTSDFSAGAKWMREQIKSQIK